MLFRSDIQRENYNVYNILMILTDGIIEDMDDTINALVELSFLPIKCNNCRNWKWRFYFYGYIRC